MNNQRGFFAIGIEHGKTVANLGTLWRSADLFGAAFIFTVGARYERRQASDVYHTRNNVPLFHFDTLDDLVNHLPYSCPLIGVELDQGAQDIKYYCHMDRSCYLL